MMKGSKNILRKIPDRDNSDIGIKIELRGNFTKTKWIYYPCRRVWYEEGNSKRLAETCFVSRQEGLAEKVNSRKKQYPKCSANGFFDILRPNSDEFFAGLR